MIRMSALELRILQNAIGTRPSPKAVNPANLPAAWIPLMEIWKQRACLVCERYGFCEHREPNVDWAEIRSQALPI